MDINLQKLEFNKILDILTKYCATTTGKNLASSLLPSNNKDEVKHSLSETEEAVNLSFRNSFPSIYDFSDINFSLKSLENGSTLSCLAILNLNNILKMAFSLKEYFNKDFIDTNDYPILSNLFDSLYSNKSIIEVIDKSILDENTISDDASVELKEIRRKQKSLEQDIRNRLNSIIHSSSAKYLQDNIITIRNDRFVIPVKEEYRSYIKGFVHDVSNAGSTLFIEPVSIFEMNNKINELKSQEEIEIEKILQKLSYLFAPYCEELKRNASLISRLDFIFAKVKYSKDINAITPKINDEKFISLLSARHPLIDASSVVPITVTLGDKFSNLLITGPNTGGKTVTLKTVGLLCLMACSGLNIPVQENSSIYVFDKIFADIGDDQSILSSLSTFSSHMLNIISILDNATPNSLVLIDELGSGTDPIEGANLAISILEQLHSSDILTIVTTHYPELKNYALVTDGFENASVEFDVDKLKPTYKLLIGIPGKSNAFAISKNLGLPNYIIERAKSMMTDEQINIEELLKNIYDQKSIIEKEKAEIDVKLKNISDLENSLKHDNESLKLQEATIINNAKVKARNILLDAKEDANEIIKELNSVSSNIKDANLLRNKLNKKISDINVVHNQSDKPKISNYNKLSLNEAIPNTEVFIRSLNKNGIILSHPSKSNEVQVQIGMLKMNVSIEDLEKISSNSSISKNTNNTVHLKSTFSSISKAKSVSTEINVIGYTVEEANFVVDKFLDDATISKLQTVRIVHGKGTGKLKDGIHRFLKSHPHVKSFRMGTYGEGEMGVTVVTLK